MFKVSTDEAIKLIQVNTGLCALNVDVLMKLIKLITLSRSVYQILFNDSRARYSLSTFIDHSFIHSFYSLKKLEITVARATSQSDSRGNPCARRTRSA